jgi:hypothetical protein
MKVTAPDSDAGTLRETGTRTVSQALATPAPSAPFLLHREPSALAEFFVFAGWVPSDLADYDSDPLFRAEVQAAMRALEATGGAR